MAGRNRSGDFDLAVVGAGLSGLLAAWAGVRAGLRVLELAPNSVEPDGRTTALLDDSISYLRDLDLWETISHEAYPLRTMRIIDATNRLIRAPQVDFISSEIGLEAFGYNIENRKLSALLKSRLTDIDQFERIEQALTDLEITSDGSVELTAENGQFYRAHALIAADGRNSLVRQKIGINDRRWDYPQIALVGNFTHSLPHHDVSTEFHTPTGPFTLVPLGTNRSSLVCVVEPAQAQDLLNTDIATLNSFLETRMNSVLGKIRLEDTLKSFPLSAMIASDFGKGPVALVGEAAHVFPPIGAQGLNLGLRDVRGAIEQTVRAKQAGRTVDFGAGYNRSRHGDITARTTSVDILNRSLLSDLVPVQAVRSLGLYTLGTVGPLRRMMMREGVAPGLGFESLGRRARETFRRPAPSGSAKPPVR